MVKSSLKPPLPTREFLSDIQFIHQLINDKPFLLDSKINEETGDTFLHGLIRDEKRFGAIAYLLARGQNITISGGINCKDLTPVTLNIKNLDGQTPLELAGTLSIQAQENHAIAQLQAPQKQAHIHLVVRKKIYHALKHASEGDIISYLEALSQNETNHKLNRYEVSLTDDLYPNILQALNNAAKNKTAYPYLDESMAPDKPSTGNKVRVAEKVEEQAIEAATPINIIPTSGYKVTPPNKRQKTIVNKE
jgi:hypothetical protein